MRASLPLAVCVLLVSTISWIRVPLLPAIGEDLSMSAATLGWVVTAFGLGRIAMDLPAGRLVDRVAPLRLFALASVAMCLSSVAMAAATVPATVMGGCLLLGVASATSNTTGMATMAGSATAERRGSAMALYSGSLLVGQALGPALGGLFASFGDWRTALGIGAAMALVVAGLAVVLDRMRRGATHAGTKRQPNPVPGPVLTRGQHLVLFTVSFAVFFTVASIPQVLIPLIGDDLLGLGATAIGLAIGSAGLARFAGALGTGLVSDHLSRRAALLPCLALQMGGVALLTMGDSVGWWLAALLVMSLGSSGHAVGATMLGDRTRPGEIGRVLGRYRFAGDLGLVTGPALVALLYQYAGSDTAALAVCTVLLTALVAAISVLPETGEKATV